MSIIVYEKKKYEKVFKDIFFIIVSYLKLLLSVGVFIFDSRP